MCVRRGRREPPVANTSVPEAVCRLGRSGAKAHSAARCRHVVISLRLRFHRRAQGEQGGLRLKALQPLIRQVGLVLAALQAASALLHLHFDLCDGTSGVSMELIAQGAEALVDPHLQLGREVAKEPPGLTHTCVVRKKAQGR